VKDACQKALENPVAGPKFSQLIGPNRSLVIITDNQFRPTPSYEYLSVMLDIIQKIGVKQASVAIGGMMVSGVLPMSDGELKTKLGADNLERMEKMGIDLFQNDPKNPDAYKFMGFAKMGTPVWCHKKVVNADVKLGLPLTQANHWGYGGGSKLALSMCSEDTINVSHELTPPLTPRTHYGALTGPMRSEIDDIGKLTDFRYALNTIMDTKLKVIDLNFGMIPDSYRKSIERYNQIYAFDIPELKNGKADITICGSHAATDHLFFHTGWGIMSADMITKDGGTIIHCSQCPGVHSAGAYFPGFALMDLMKPYMPPTPENFEKLVRDVFRRKAEIWSGSIWIPIYEVMVRKHLAIITRKDNLSATKEIGLDATDSIQEAFDSALKRSGKDAKVVILPYSRHQFPKWAVEM